MITTTTHFFKKSFLTAFLLFATVFATLPTHALSGVPGAFTAGNNQLVLNGAGKRTKFIITVYHAGLYLKKKSNNAQQILAADQPMAIRMKIISGLASAEKMKTAMVDGFKNSTGGNTAPVQAQIDEFLKAGLSSDVSKGDAFDMVYTPGAGTQFLKNGKQLALLRGLPFKKALFGIWLSNKPAQASLKNQMLGK